MINLAVDEDNGLNPGIADSVFGVGGFELLELGPDVRGGIE
jgi:hypothetical protein